MSKWGTSVSARRCAANILFLFAIGCLVASFVGGGKQTSDIKIQVNLRQLSDMSCNRLVILYLIAWIRASASASSSGVNTRRTAAFGLWTITFQETLSTEEMAVTTSHEVTYQAW
jgi:hypothetical protein